MDDEQAEQAQRFKAMQAELLAKETEFQARMKALARGRPTPPEGGIVTKDFLTAALKESEERIILAIKEMLA